MGIKFAYLILVHLHVVVNKLDQLLHIDFLSLGHFSLEILIFLLNEIVLFKDFIEAILSPLHRAFLGDTRRIKHLSFLGISRLTET